MDEHLRDGPTHLTHLDMRKVALERAVQHLQPRQVLERVAPDDVVRFATAFETFLTRDPE